MTPWMTVETGWIKMDGSRYAGEPWWSVVYVQPPYVGWWLPGERA